jgi:hypothetical protein
LKLKAEKLLIGVGVFELAQAGRTGVVVAPKSIDSSAM